jgi:hypothetical protein
VNDRKFERMMSSPRLPAWWSKLTYAWQDHWPDYDYEDDGVPVASWAAEHPSKKVSNPKDANLVLSAAKYGDGHFPLIDLDHDAALLPSSTPGNHHLYIDHRLTWKQYKKLLKVMVDVGLVEEGFYECTKARGHGALRLPWVKKGEECL